MIKFSCHIDSIFFILTYSHFFIHFHSNRTFLPTMTKNKIWSLSINYLHHKNWMLYSTFHLNIHWLNNFLLSLCHNYFCMSHIKMFMHHYLFNLKYHCYSNQINYICCLLNYNVFILICLLNLDYLVTLHPRLN